MNTLLPLMNFIEEATRMLPKRGQGGRVLYLHLLAQVRDAFVLTAVGVSRPRLSVNLLSYALKLVRIVGFLPTSRP